MKKGSIKNKRINEEVLRALTAILRDDVGDPRIDPLISVTKVEVSPDLMYCKVHVSTLGDDIRMDECLKGLYSSAGFIRSRLAATVNLRKTPELKFIPDRGMSYAMEISQKIDAVMAGEESHD